MEGLGNLDSFIEGCDATKMGAFLELVHRRFSEAQAQKQKRVESYVSGLHEQLLAQASGKKSQLEQHINNTLLSLRKKRDNATAELGQILEGARAKKQTLLLSFQEQEKACEDVEKEMRELTQEFTHRKKTMERNQKQALRQFFEGAVQKIKKEQDETCMSLQEGEEERQQATQMLLQLLLAYAGPNAVSLLASIQPTWH